MSAPGVRSEIVRDRLLAALLEHAPVSPRMETGLRAAIDEAVRRPGKLVRGRLAWETVTAHGLDEESGLTLATAVEYFHAASLLLDDLPCMDNAVARRGHLCVHRVHGEATAIMAALALINRAYALVGFAFATQPGAVRLQAQACVDACLGTAGLVGGQARDLRFSASARTAREVSRVAIEKTGAMFWLALLLPALLTAPTGAERRALEALCVYWGLAYQAADDLQDLLASAEETGKTGGRDRLLGRPNLAAAIGVPATRGRIDRLLGQAARTIDKLVEVREAWSYLEEFQRHFSGILVPAAAESAEVAA